MSGMPEHAKPPAKRDHLWVVVIIAACCLIEVWASWVAIGSMSGFPKLFGKVSTDWTLAVTTEAYWAYALYAWLAAAPGPRSRRFAMWSAGVVFLLSLTGQGSAHLVKPNTQPPAALVVFVSALPVIVLASIAVLIHFRQADREETERDVRARAEAEKLAAIERAEADERTALRAELEALGHRLAEAESGRAEAGQRAAHAEAETAKLARKLAAQNEAKNGRRARAAKSENSRRSARAAADPNDVDARTKALKILAENPGISGAQLGLSAGKSARWGQLHRDELAAMAAEFDGDGQDAARAADDNDEGSAP